MKQEIFDITIIGAGPVGLFTAFYAQMRNAKVKVIDSLEGVGGQPTFLYGEKIIYDIPAYPAIKGKDLGEKLLQQLDHFDTCFCLGEEVQSIKQIESNLYQLQTPKQNHLSRTIIIAAGNGAFQPRKLDLEEAANFEGKSLHYLVHDPYFFKDQTIAICGGGDSALDWALSLEPICKKIYLIHRRPQFRAMEHTVTLVEQSSVELVTPYLLKSIHTSQQGLPTLNLTKVKGTDEVTLEVDHLIVNYGFTSSIGPIKNWPLEFDRNQILVDSHLETKLPGVFAIGDIAQYPGKVRIIASGFGEAPLAVHYALQRINPDKPILPIHSSSIFEGAYHDTNS